MSRLYNFGAGPAMLPLEVMQQIQSDLPDWQGVGCSEMEVSHHSPEFYALAAKVEQDLRELLNVPANYKILFLSGGGRSQFAMVPLNLLSDRNTANYLETGVWSKLALVEASRYCSVNLVASSAEQNYLTIPAPSTWVVDEKSAYFYYVDNETVNGTEFPEAPKVNKDLPLVSDMSSNLLSREFDFAPFGLVFACAQKNIGIAGLTVVIVREDLLGREMPITPTMFNYKVHADNKSLYNTPPTFPWYVTGLVLEWVKRQGGVKAMEKLNARKSEKLYTYIDGSGFYNCPVDTHYRSRMNVVFKLADEQLDTEFLAAAKAAGIIGIKGHKLVGGMRASLYNAVPEAAVDALIAMMQDFAQRYN